MRRVGAIDMGTNSTRLLVADVEDGELVELERLLTITRMGDGVDARRRLSPEAIGRLQVSMAEFLVLWRAFGDVARPARAARTFFKTK